MITGVGTPDTDITLVKVDPTTSAGIEEEGRVGPEIVGLLAGSTLTRLVLPLEIFPA